MGGHRNILSPPTLKCEGNMYPLSPPAGSGPCMLHGVNDWRSSSRQLFSTNCRLGPSFKFAKFGRGEGGVTSYFSRKFVNLNAGPSNFAQGFSLLTNLSMGGCHFRSFRAHRKTSVFTLAHTSKKIKGKIAEGPPVISAGVP